MKFKETRTTANFPLLRMVSEGEKWELGYVPMMFGVRVRLGRTAHGCLEVDLCCGADAALRAEVLGYVLMSLADKPEDILPRTISQMFPLPKIKPLDLDPVWVDKLQQFKDLVKLPS